AQKYLGRPIPIVIHGYDYALPDGRGFWGGWGPLPGPWLEPGFQRKGHVDFGENSAVVVKLIDRFNTMLKDVSATPGFEHVHYLNLRNTLRHGANYEKDWENELHPTEEGFALVSKKVCRPDCETLNRHYCQTRGSRLGCGSPLDMCATSRSSSLAGRL